jgi:hypothetical protein
MLLCSCSRLQKVLKEQERCKISVYPFSIIFRGSEMVFLDGCCGECLCVSRVTVYWFPCHHKAL